MTPLQEKTAPHITEIIRRLQMAGYEAYVAGGAVRDFLLERDPKDYDVSCSATPAQIRKVFRKQRCFAIGRRFRLVHLYCGNDLVEISTFRKQPRPENTMHEAFSAGGMPEHMIFQDNEYGSAEDDAHRRDFTVNALFYNPVEDRLIDHTGYGVSDILSRQVRSIGDPVIRFEEDPVRILRALKLVGQYGFTLEHTTCEAVKKCMPLIVHASPSRMTLELEKILKNSYGDRILRVFREYGFLRYFLPYLDERFDSPQATCVMRLFEKYNEKLRAGLLFPSLPVVFALFILPFLEEEAGSSPGGLWDPAVFPPADTTDDPPVSAKKKTGKWFRQILLDVFRPHTTTRLTSSTALDILRLQPELKAGRMDPAALFAAPHYAEARGLAILQNELFWHFTDPEKRFPPPPPDPPGSENKSLNPVNKPFRRKKKRFHRPGQNHGQEEGNTRSPETGQWNEAENHNR